MFSALFGLWYDDVRSGHWWWFMVRIIHPDLWLYIHILNNTCFVNKTALFILPTRPYSGTAKMKTGVLRSSFLVFFLCFWNFNQCKFIFNLIIYLIMFSPAIFNWRIDGFTQFLWFYFLKIASQMIYAQFFLIRRYRFLKKVLISLTVCFFLNGKSSYKCEQCRPSCQI